MGASRTWVIQTDRQHVVQLQHARHRGWAKITVDGVAVFQQDEPTALWDEGFDREFLVGNVPCRIHIHQWRPKPGYTLWVNGIQQPSDSQDE